MMCIRRRPTTAFVLLLSTILVGASLARDVSFYSIPDLTGGTDLVVIADDEEQQPQEPSSTGLNSPLPKQQPLQSPAGGGNDMLPKKKTTVAGVKMTATPPHPKSPNNAVPQQQQPIQLPGKGSSMGSSASGSSPPLRLSLPSTSGTLPKQQQQQQQQGPPSPQAHRPLQAQQKQPRQQVDGPTSPRQQARVLQAVDTAPGVRGSVPLAGAQQQQQSQVAGQQHIPLHQQPQPQQQQQLGGQGVAGMPEQEGQGPQQQPPRQGSVQQQPPAQQQGPAQQQVGLQQQQQQQQQQNAGQGPLQPQQAEFDFIVGGFPKCGTTTLLKAFEAHPETEMAPQEQCSVAAPAQADLLVLKKLDETLAGMSSSGEIKRSFKCPTAMYNYRSIVRMEKHSPHTKFVVGIRHPIKMLQSFYNYRITEIYERGLAGTEPIPDFLDLLTDSATPWKGVSMSSVRFELFLMQLGKTNVTPEELQEMADEKGYELAIKPNTFPVFLYSVDELEDEDEGRSQLFRTKLQTYLGLTTPIEPFGHENKNHQVGDSGHKESIDICDPQYADIRRQLIENGIKTAAWLREKFFKSPDVVLANPEYFAETLESWGTDPCSDAAVEATGSASEQQI